MRKLIKSPMNYIGGKYKLLNQILPLFPQKINMFYDIFGGGGSLSLNVQSEHVYYNDIVSYISDMFRELKGEDEELCINKIKNIITDFQLSKNNEIGFKKLRDFYNNGNREWYIFYTLMCFSFNNQFRFNNQQQYNSSFGKHKSCFSHITEEKFRAFILRLNEIDITFDKKDFRDIDYSDADSNDLVYLDPPYIISCGNYNDGKRGFRGWSVNDDLDLMNLCDKLERQGTRFAMSNILEHKGVKNEPLISWSKKYNVNELKHNYNNCNYQQNNKKFKTKEVLITNY